MDVGAAVVAATSLPAHLPEALRQLPEAAIASASGGGRSATSAVLAVVGTRGTGASLTFVRMTPTLSSLPGGSSLQRLINGLGGWALLLTLAGLLIGAALWALGAHSQNYQQSYIGRRAVLVSALAALLVGVGPELIRFFYTTGSQVK